MLSDVHAGAMAPKFSGGHMVDEQTSPLRFGFIMNNHVLEDEIELLSLKLKIIHGLFHEDSPRDLTNKS